MSDERLARIESAVQELRDRVDTGFLQQRDYTDGVVRDLRTHMGVLVEELVDRIKGTAEPPDQLRREMRAGDAAVRAECDQRLTPLEHAVKDHSAELKRLKDRRT